jgi:hypothetical protein
MVFEIFTSLNPEITPLSAMPSLLDWVIVDLEFYLRAPGGVA